MKRHARAAGIACLMLLGVSCNAPEKSASQWRANDAHKTRAPKPTMASAGMAATRLRVNGDVVDVDDIWRGMRADFQERAANMPRPEYEGFVRRLATERLGDKITEMLLYQAASKRLPPEAIERVDWIVDGQIREIVSAEHGGSQHRYERHLKTQGRKLDEVHDEIRRELIIQSFLQGEVRSKVADPTRAELLAIFDQSKDQWRREPRRRMSLIEVRALARLPRDVTSPSRTQMDDARLEARMIAETVKTELSSGTPFDQVARNRSDGTHAPDGGQWGWVARGALRERLDPVVEVLYLLPVFGVSEIIESDDSFFVARCDEIDPGFVPTFEVVQPQLQQQHAQLAFSARVQELIAKHRRLAEIDPDQLERFFDAVVAAAPRP